MQEIASRCQLFADQCLNIAERVGAEDADKLRSMAAVWLSVATEALNRTSRDQRAFQTIN